jgi:hypothetical protein
MELLNERIRVLKTGCVFIKTENISFYLLEKAKKIPPRSSERAESLFI